MKVIYLTYLLIQTTDVGWIAQTPIWPCCSPVQHPCLCRDEQGHWRVSPSSWTSSSSKCVSAHWSFSPQSQLSWAELQKSAAGRRLPFYSDTQCLNRHGSNTAATQGGYIFCAGGSIAGVSCRRRWPPPTTLALTTLVAQCELSGC